MNAGRQDPDVRDHPLVVEYLESVEAQAAQLDPVERAQVVLAAWERAGSHLRQRAGASPLDARAVAEALGELRRDDPDHDDPGRADPRTAGAAFEPHGERASTHEGAAPGLVAAVVAPQGLTIAAGISLLLLAVNPFLAALVGVVVAGTAWHRGAAEGPLRRSPYRTPVLLGLVPPVLLVALLAFAAVGSLMDPYSPLRS